MIDTNQPFSSTMRRVREEVSKSRRDSRALDHSTVFIDLESSRERLGDNYEDGDPQKIFDEAVRLAAIAVRMAEELRVLGEEPCIPPTHYVLPRRQHTVVKGAEFFAYQGGLKDDWGKHWKPVTAHSIEHARDIGSELDPIPGWE